MDISTKCSSDNVPTVALRIAANPSIDPTSSTTPKKSRSRVSGIIVKNIGKLRGLPSRRHLQCEEEVQKRIRLITQERIYKKKRNLVEQLMKFFIDHEAVIFENTIACDHKFESLKTNIELFYDRFILENPEWADKLNSLQMTLPVLIKRILSYFYGWSQGMTEELRADRSTKKRSAVREWTGIRVFPSRQPSFAKNAPRPEKKFRPTHVRGVARPHVLALPPPPPPPPPPPSLLDAGLFAEEFSIKADVHGLLTDQKNFELGCTKTKPQIVHSECLATIAKKESAIGSMREIITQMKRRLASLQKLESEKEAGSQKEAMFTVRSTFSPNLGAIVINTQSYKCDDIVIRHSLHPKSLKISLRTILKPWGFYDARYSSLPDHDRTHGESVLEIKLPHKYDCLKIVKQTDSYINIEVTPETSKSYSRLVGFAGSINLKKPKKSIPKQPMRPAQKTRKLFTKRQSLQTTQPTTSECDEPCSKTSATSSVDQPTTGECDKPCASSTTPSFDQPTTGVFDKPCDTTSTTQSVDQPTADGYDKTSAASSTTPSVDQPTADACEKTSAASSTTTSVDEHQYGQKKCAEESIECTGENAFHSKDIVSCSERKCRIKGSKYDCGYCSNSWHVSCMKKLGVKQSSLVRRGSFIVCPAHELCEICSLVIDLGQIQVLCGGTPGCRKLHASCLKKLRCEKLPCRVCGEIF